MYSYRLDPMCKFNREQHEFCIKNRVIEGAPLRKFKIKTYIFSAISE